MLLGLGNQSFEPLDRLSFEPAALVFGVLDLRPVDQGVEADVDVPRDFLDLAGSLPGLLRDPGARAPPAKRNCSTLTRSGWGRTSAGTGLASFGAGLMSWKTVGCLRVIWLVASVSTTKSRRWSVRPRPSLTEAAKTSRTLGAFRWMS